MRYMIEGDVLIPYHVPRYNVAPSQSVLAVIHDGEKNKLGELQWGLIPPWADSPKTGLSMINARSESAAAKPAFKTALRRKRCIIPADGFYEWQTTSSGKQPMRIVRKDRGIFSMAGLYETWTSGDGARISSCTILTTAPNELMAPIHDRMPVILRREDEPHWLDRRIVEPGQLEQLLKPYAAGELEAYPVAAAVGNARRDNADCIEPIQLDEQLGLW